MVMPKSGVPMQQSFETAIDRLFEEALSSINQSRQAWIPACNVYQDTNGLTIEMALPGLTPKDIDVQLEDGALTIKGSYSRTNEHKERSILVHEFGRGSFERTISLPPIVDPQQTRASFKDGVLVVTCPMQEAAKPRRILIEG